MIKGGQKIGRILARTSVEAPDYPSGGKISLFVLRVKHFRPFQARKSKYPGLAPEVLPLRPAKCQENMIFGLI